MRPKGITDEHLEYLDDLRESGVTNMYGGRQFIIDEFGVNRNFAREILTYWMKSFGKSGR